MNEPLMEKFYWVEDIELAVAQFTNEAGVRLASLNRMTARDLSRLAAAFSSAHLRIDDLLPVGERGRP